jgi:type IV pilus assembly protein PilE
MARQTRRIGFTLTEVLITVTIIALLASMAVPQFQRTTERSYWRSARDILETAYAGEQIYFIQQKAYVDADDVAVCNPVWRCVFMDNPNVAGDSLPVTFSTTMPTSVTFTATAKRDGGPCNGKTQTIDQDRVFGGDWPADGGC